MNSTHSLSKPLRIFALIATLSVLFLGLLAAHQAFADSDAELLYKFCTAYWRQIDWKHKPDHRALVGAINNNHTHTCYARWGEATAEAAKEAAVTSCRKDYQNCYTFAEDDSLVPWAQELIDKKTGINRPNRAYAFIECTLPTIWSDYLTNYLKGNGPKAMAVSNKGTESQCTWSSGSNYKMAAAYALSSCRSASKQDCSLFAVGNYIEPDWLKVGDLLRKKTRPASEYDALACSNPLVQEAYFGEPRHKAIAIGIKKSGGDVSCFSANGEASPNQATKAALDRCRSEAGLDCYEFAVDSNFAPWVRIAVDSLAGKKRSTDAYMAYACLYESYSTDYPSRSIHKGAIAQYTSQTGYNCMWRSGDNSTAVTLEKLLAGCQMDAPKGSHPKCSIVAIDNVIQPTFAALLGLQKTTAKSDEGTHTFRIDASQQYCATTDHVRGERLCETGELKLSAKDAVTLINGWGTRICVRATPDSYQTVMFYKAGQSGQCTSSELAYERLKL